MRSVQRFFTRMFRKSQPTQGRPAGASAALSPKLMAMLARTAEAELTCDEVFELLDQFAEMARRGENVAGLMPLVQQHLHLCPDCREEYEALKRVLEQG